jgi:hypothetical protein
MQRHKRPATVLASAIAFTAMTAILITAAEVQTQLTCAGINPADCAGVGPQGAVGRAMPATLSLSVGSLAAFTPVSH